eukprot:TRINITY_DN4488_c1_g1_i1.p2 TRINITY_DN4488_c1_g1~~TRINITY_DN4488_c1_g1_i1.p2  ORF type:complete len:108 (-),score=5.80 TRINITY_DN4488_c1_g1_i1:139-462(-)
MTYTRTAPGPKASAVEELAHGTLQLPRAACTEQPQRFRLRPRWPPPRTPTKQWKEVGTYPHKNRYICAPVDGGDQGQRKSAENVSKEKANHRRKNTEASAAFLPVQC